MIEIKINTPYIKLDQLLKYAGIVEIGSAARELIKSGMILVNGQVVIERGKKIKNKDIVEIKDRQKILVLGD